MDEVHKQEFKVRDLPTRSVTLFPTQAQIVREIKDVQLRPGANQIVVVGFSPTVNENSIKVEGTGSAIISDIAVELLPNREIFEDIYPDEDEDDSDDDKEDNDDDESSESSSDESSSNADKRKRKELDVQLTQLRDDQLRAHETVSSAASRLKIMDAYGKMLDRKRNVDIGDGVELYRGERAKIFDAHMAGTQKDRALSEEIAKLEGQQRRVQKRLDRAAEKKTKIQTKARIAKEKLRLAELRRRAEREAEKLRVHKEREQFWAKKCYTIRITLDAPGSGSSNRGSAASSRRSSFASIELAKETPEASISGNVDDDGNSTLPVCDLAISYITTSAFWAPSYDLQLSTTTNTAQLCFDAKLTNTTYESWNACKVTLSTSQTNVSSLNDSIPLLVPWRVRLARGYGFDDLVASTEEKQHQQAWHVQQNAGFQSKPRGDLFGIEPSMRLDMLDSMGVGALQAAARQFKATRKEQQKGIIATSSSPFSTMARRTSGPSAFHASSTFSSQPQLQQQFQQQRMQMQQQQESTWQPPRSGGLFGSGQAVAQAVAPPPPPPPPPAAAAAAPVLLGAAAPAALARTRRRSGSDSEPEEYADAAGADEATILPEAQPNMDFQESSFEETGMTTTYDLPGLKNLLPSSTASKQRVARVSFSTVAFSHTVIAKYRPAAYLKAKIKNTSKITLLRGPTSLTLDGSFMGNTTLPRCSPGNTVPLNLGIDPTIRVAYPKPDVKRSTVGLFSKENSHVCRRTIVLTNTRDPGGKGSKNAKHPSTSTSPPPATLVVLDQVPISEDEKIRIVIHEPRGVAVGAEPVSTGIGNVVNGSLDKPVPGIEWGSAKAILKKAGEVVWDVKLHAGRAVKLSLDFEIALPTGEGGVQQC